MSKNKNAKFAKAFDLCLIDIPKKSYHGKRNYSKTKEYKNKLQQLSKAGKKYVTK